MEFFTLRRQCRRRKFLGIRVFLNLLVANPRRCEPEEVWWSRCSC
ncbi:hypothetical protein HanHA300_Chr14g0510011 [Helianthus annuus]|nr:hypothetical protein HanHA300_Chr14g0510011 [Helianthus annuus]KAJ0484327.1 hypothetical protein HanHA89_Chr14g0542921 [Helianthus annuus]KAJ0654880.1 hypothetical protein HanLR1_Chr14g0512161 [Helianthus annuus]